MTSPAPEYSMSYPITPGPGFVEDWGHTMSTLEHDGGSDTLASATTKKDSITASPLSQHPDIMTPGLEAIYHGDQGKEVVPQSAQDPFYAYKNGENLPPDPSSGVKNHRTICGLRALTCGIIGVVLLVLLGLGLGLGLGFGLQHNDTSTSDANGNPFDPRYLSTTGAFNGTGIAIASYSFDTDGYGLINVYFQHHSGQIRKMQLMKNGDWLGGDASNIVATDARNATPISAVAYAMDQKSTWHIFYIDHNNIIREKINDNTTNNWRDGPISELNLQAMNERSVGLQACWYGSFYGDANYTHSPIPETGSNTTSKDQVIGMHLWYGRDKTTQHEVTWTYNTTQWYDRGDIFANGHAGVGCYTWGPGSVNYVMMVNLDNEIQISWKDLNSSVVATDSHPVNTWVNTTFTIPNVRPDTSLGYTNYFYAQATDGKIKGYDIQWAAENTSLRDSFTIPRTALAEIHFSVTAVPDTSGGDTLMVFCQNNGSDINQSLRDLQSGQWSYLDLPIPDT